jgi:hypothetical protein
MEKCSEVYTSATKNTDPFIVTERDEKEFFGHSNLFKDSDTGHSSLSKEADVQYSEYEDDFKIPSLYFYARALEGAHGCIRACSDHLEKTGKIKNLFKNQFRKKKPWKLQGM